MTITWLTAEEAAIHTRLANTRRILQAVKDGELPVYSPFKSNDIRHIRFKQSDVDAWLESQPWEPK